MTQIKQFLLFLSIVIQLDRIIHITGSLMEK